MTGPKPAPLTADMLPSMIDLGRNLNKLGRFREAAWCFERGLQLDPSLPALYLGLAQTRELEGRFGEARELIGMALRHGAGVADCETRIGVTFRSEGDFAAAAAAFGRAVAADPAHGQAQIRLSQLGRAADPGGRIAELEDVLRRPGLSSDQLATLNFAVAHEHALAGDHDSAFVHYRRANDVRRGEHPYTANVEAAERRMTAQFPAAFFTARRHLGNATERPVFVVGMMRSGTTLVEQILASHRDVRGHGELTNIPQIAHALPSELGGVAYPECLAGIDRATLRKVTASYVARLDQDGPAALRDVDKLPHNFENVGLIALMFPQARIIHCARHPLDTCLSNYFLDYGQQNAFTYDLAALGRYHVYHDRLMAHWRTVLPRMILRVPYEELVADQEGWSRRMVEFLGLDWDPACLEFHHGQRAVFTHSQWQVRQPIFSNSIDRWRPYARHLDPLFAALGLAEPAE